MGNKERKSHQDETTVLSSRNKLVPSMIEQVCMG